jgi:hypothetical protein
MLAMNEKTEIHLDDCPLPAFNIALERGKVYKIGQWNPPDLGKYVKSFAMTSNMGLGLWERFYLFEMINSKSLRDSTRLIPTGAYCISRRRVGDFEGYENFIKIFFCPLVFGDSEEEVTKNFRGSMTYE